MNYFGRTTSYILLEIGIFLIAVGSFWSGMLCIEERQRINLDHPILRAYGLDVHTGYQYAVGLNSTDVHCFWSDRVFVAYGIAPNGTDEIYLFDSFYSDLILAHTYTSLDGTFAIVYQKR